MMNNEPVTCNPVTCNSPGSSWKWHSFSIFNIAFSIILCGCVKDTLHHTSHPDRGAVSVSVERVRSSGSANGETTGYRARVGEIEEDIPSGRGALATLFAPGTYNLLVHDIPAGMTSRGTVVSVNTLPDGTLEPFPADLFHDRCRVVVVADDTLDVVMSLPRRSRQLTLQMTLAGGDPSRVAKIEARLTGITGAVDMVDGTPRGEPATVKPVFSLATLTGDKRAKKVLIARMNLLGVFPGSEQRFTLVITAMDGQQQTMEVNMTAVLASFNESNTPLLFDSDLELMQTGDFGFNISDWTEGMPPGEGEAV